MDSDNAGYAIGRRVAEIIFKQARSPITASLRDAVICEAESIIKDRRVTDPLEQDFQSKRRTLKIKPISEKEAVDLTGMHRYEDSQGKVGTAMDGLISRFYLFS
jgi:hypothetical protein